MLDKWLVRGTDPAHSVNRRTYTSSGLRAERPERAQSLYQVRCPYGDEGLAKDFADFA